MILFRDKTKPSKHNSEPAGQITYLFASDTSKVLAVVFMCLTTKEMRMRIVRACVRLIKGDYFSSIVSTLWRDI